MTMRPLAWIGGALLLVAACTQTSIVADPHAERGGTIIDGLVSEVRTLQPVLSADSSSAHAWSFVYRPLVRPNPRTGLLEGELAASAEINADASTITYRLRDGLVWSDGTPFTGEDYKFTVEAVLRSRRSGTKKIPLQDIIGAAEFERGTASEVSGVEVLDGGRTIRLRLKQVVCPNLVALGAAGAGGIIPKKHFGRYLDPNDPQKNLDTAPENAAPPASMGPFVFKELKADEIVYERNERYFRGPPLVERYVLRAYADADAAKAALLAGDLHFLLVQADDVDDISTSSTLALHRFPSLTYTYLAWNPRAKTAPWLQLREVRQALTYGLDMERLVRESLSGLGRRVFAHTPPASWAYEERDLVRYPYDPARATDLLERSGATRGGAGSYQWGEERTMAMTIEYAAGNETREATARRAQEDYERIGLVIGLRPAPIADLVGRIRFGSNEVEAWILSYSLEPDPSPLLFWHSNATGHFNRTGYSNPRADEAMIEQLAVRGCDTKERRELIHVVDRALNEDVPFTFLYSPDDLLFANKALQGLEPGPYGIYWNVERWWLKP